MIRIFGDRRLKENYIIFLLYLNVFLFLLRVLEKYLISRESDYFYFIAVVLNGILWVPAFFTSRLNVLIGCFLLLVAIATESCSDFILDFKVYFILIGFLMVLESPGLNLDKLKRHALIALNLAIAYFALEVGVRLLDPEFYLSLKSTVFGPYYDLIALSNESSEILKNWIQPGGVNLDGHSTALLIILFFIEQRNMLLKIFACILLYFSNVKTWFFGFVAINIVYFTQYLRSMRKTSFNFGLKCIIVPCSFVLAVGLIILIYKIKQPAIDLNIAIWRDNWWDLISFAVYPHGFPGWPLENPPPVAGSKSPTPGVGRTGLT